jgi:hypothetical protein
MTPRSTYANADQEARSVQITDTSRRSIDWGFRLGRERGSFHSMLAASTA